jgi:hypothetical protein
MNNRGRSLKDASGTKAEEKDLWRMRDMKKKAAGDDARLLKLATQMAGAIKDKDKALRRADAASQIFDGSIGTKLVKIFKDAANHL